MQRADQNRSISPLRLVAESEIEEMNTPLRSELYTNREDFAVMTRTSVITDVQLERIADRLRQNAEDLVSSTNPPTAENCRVAGAMVGWSFSIAPIRIEVKFEY